MDQITLVGNHVDQGQRFLDQLVAAGFDVTGAAWVKPTASQEWRLYVVSKDVDQKGLAAAARSIHPVLQKQPDPWTSLSELNLIRTTEPIAKDILELQRRTGRYPIHSRRPRLGDLVVDEVYVYPAPLPPEEIWRGISIMVFQESERSQAYRVEFWPQELQAAMGPNGQPRRVPRAASVRIEGGKATDYRPPEKPLLQIDKSDYEQKALEAVEFLEPRTA